jgi:ABC-type transport system involved in multi-copper enzyme maturation permease subunit
VSDSYLGATESELRDASLARRICGYSDQRVLFPHAGRLRLEPRVLVPGGWRMIPKAARESCPQMGAAPARLDRRGSAGIMIRRIAAGSVLAALMIISISGCHFHVTVHASPGLITGYESADGVHWTKVGAAQLPGLPSTVQAGLFAASPRYAKAAAASIGVTTGISGPSQATAVFGHVTLQGAGSSGAWTGSQMGSSAASPAASLGGFRQAGDDFTVSGSGDIAPAVAGGAGAGSAIERTLTGTFLGLIVVIVVGAIFITAEYRRNLIRTTLTASPQRGRVLAAKAIVIGSVTFAAGLAGAALALLLGEQALRDSGNYIYPVTKLTDVRVVAGTAALLAVAAVLALALGTLTRHGAAAVAAAIVMIVLPYLFAIASVLPPGTANWMLRVTPAAAFAIQQTLPQYPQVAAAYTPSNGYYPLAPWAGLGVLCAWAVLALTAAVFLLGRKDA